MLQQGTLPPSRAAWLTREVADAIAAGHAPGRRPRPAEPRGGAGHPRRRGQADRVRRRRQPPAQPAAGPAVRRARRARGRRDQPRRHPLRRADRPVARRRPVRRTPAPRGRAVARCARARCAPACPGPWTRSASGCCTRRPRSTRCRSRPPTRSPPPWPTTSATPAGRAARRRRHARRARPSRSTATPWPRPRPTRAAGPSRRSERHPGRRPPRPTQPATVGHGATGRAPRPARTTPGGDAGLPRARQDPDSLAPLHAPPRAERHRRRRSRTFPSDRCSPPPSAGSRAAARGSRPAAQPAPSQPRRPPGATDDRLAARGRLAPPAATSDTGTGLLAVHRRGRGQERRPHRQGGPRLAADGDRGRRTPRRWSWPWRSPSTAAARTATTTVGPGAEPLQLGRRAGRRDDRRSPASRDFDPEGDPPEENPDEAPNAIDGDPATSWTTSTYRGNPALGGLKPGVGADARPRQGPEGRVG